MFPLGFGTPKEHNPHMEAFETVQCPFCGETFELAVDTGIDSQTFNTDCEICCRPFEVSVECHNHEVKSVDAVGGGG